MPNVNTFPYDEFAYFHENLHEWSLHVPSRGLEILRERRRSAPAEWLRWGTGDPELVLLHGGAQNAHTYDTVALALGRPLLALDLPGHGHSDASPFPAAAIASHALDVAERWTS